MKSIDIPTKEQQESIDFYVNQGYTWDRELSASLCAVVIKKDNVIHVYDLDGVIHLNFDMKNAIHLSI